MPVDLSNILVVGISSRSLFSLEHENEIFNSEGITAFRKHQAENENVILDPGPSFQLVKKLLDLNKISSQQVVEIVVMSSNSPQTGMRVMNSIKAHNLDITRMAFTGGQPISSYLPGYGVDLFLSRDEDDVQKVIDSKLAAAAGENVLSAHKILCWFVLVGWAIYPLGYMLGTDGWYTSIVGKGNVDVAYNIADAINKIGFGLVIYSLAVKSQND